MSIANASQVRLPCESPVPSRPVPFLLPIHCLHRQAPRRKADGPLRGSSGRWVVMD